MRLLVTGGRDFEATEFAWTLLDKIHARRPITLLIEGGARGADRIARLWAIANKVTIQTFDADWETYGNHAGRVRNARMLREGRPECVVAFEGRTGTRHMVRIAKEANIPVFESWRYMVTVTRRKPRAG